MQPCFKKKQKITPKCAWPYLHPYLLDSYTRLLNFTLKSLAGSIFGTRPTGEEPERGRVEGGERWELPSYYDCQLL